MSRPKPIKNSLYVGMAELPTSTELESIEGTGPAMGYEVHIHCAASMSM